MSRYVTFRKVYGRRDESNPVEITAPVYSCIIETPPQEFVLTSQTFEVEIPGRVIEIFSVPPSPPEFYFIPDKPTKTT